MKKYFIWLFFLFVAGYISSCSYISNSRSNALDLMKIGDPIENVFKEFGTPDFREEQNKLFSRYATSPCINPCVERIWFENKLGLIVDEAWSFEIDDQGKVIGKAYWFST